MSLMTRRHEAVTEALAEIRDRRDTIGPSEALLEAVAPILIGLGQRGELFPQETFRVELGSKMTIYELSADPDGRLGLYASAGLPGKAQPPHDHRTWSCIAGIRGAEWNRYFERVDDGSAPHHGVLEPRGEAVLRTGDASGMMGHRFHAIEVIEDEPALHLHLYGDTLDRLTGRVYFESESGGEVMPFMTSPDLHTALVTAGELAEMLADGEELAVIDVRELGEWGRGHILRSSPLPRSRLELEAPGLLPRSEVRVVVIAADNLRAHEAAHRFRRGGYRNVAVLDGGIEACRIAGITIHSGMGTFEKAFAELVLSGSGTPKISVSGYRLLQAEGRDHALLDCRPTTEYEALRVPGARSAPGMTLTAAVEELDLDESTPVVISCAGRTRSIIGAQTLRDLGLRNPIMSLEGGAMGWRLDGGELEHGPEPQPHITVGVAARHRAAERARRLAADRGIPLIGEATLATLRADPQRSTYLFDVRTPERYATGHRAEFQSAPGGQLLQELTQRVAVHGARIVLVDLDGTEAILTAHWLMQMGFDACVLMDGLVGQHLITATEHRHLLDPAPTEAVSWHAVAPETESGAVVIDCALSRSYRQGHIPGSRHCVRSRLEPGLESLDADRLIFTSEDGELARFAAADAAQLGWSAAHLIGGNEAWRRAGRSLTVDGACYLVEPDDIWAKPYEISTDETEAMKRYLEWEVDLLRTVELGDLTALARR